MATNDDYTVTVKTVFDKNQTKKDWNKLLKELQKEIKLKVNMDNTSLKKSTNDLNKILNQLKSIQDTKISVIAPAQTSRVQNASSAASASDSGASAAMDTVNSWINDDNIVSNLIETFKNMASDVKEFDAIQTTLMTTTKKSSQEVKKLMYSYMALGKELHVTGIEAAQTASEWLNLDKTTAETEILTKASIILSKISGLDPEQSTGYLSQIIDGYNISAENVINILDKISAVSSSSGSDMDSLMQKLALTAENASLAEISIDSLLGYIAAMGDNSEAGSALNSVFSRMENIRSSRLESYQNNGNDLSDVESTLSSEGISLRSPNRSFKDTEDILDEAADKWTSFSETSQRSIAEAFAGSKHVEDFISLMDNFAQTQEYAEDSADSTGQTMQQFGTYTDSLEGKLQQFESAFQSLSNTVLDSELLKFFVDLGTTGVGAIETISKTLTSSQAFGILAGGILSAKNIGQGKSRPVQYAYPC